MWNPIQIELKRNIKDCDLKRDPSTLLLSISNIFFPTNICQKISTAASFVIQTLQNQSLIQAQQCHSYLFVCTPSSMFSSESPKWKTCCEALKAATEIFLSWRRFWDCLFMITRENSDNCPYQYLHLKIDNEITEKHSLILKPEKLDPVSFWASLSY